MEDKAEGWTARGDVAMNEQSPRSGHGEYVQELRDDRILFGTWDVQVMNRDTLLVHTTYSSVRDSREVLSAFLWERDK